MNKSESKYFNTALLMDKAFLELLDIKDFEYITVKEICERAGVNRSTFYLHYETVADLLEESIEYMNKQFKEYFLFEEKFCAENIENADLEKLYLITPKYLLPYLRYTKDNKKLFRVAIEKAHILKSQNKYDALFKNIIAPIMSRYHIPEEKKHYILSFYINGIISIILLWLKNDCKESIEMILEIIMSCIINPYSQNGT